VQQYLDLVRRVLWDGEPTPTRTGIEAYSKFGEMMAFDLRRGFPILTTKKILWGTVVDELLWFIRGGHNINDADVPKKIWDAWADENGELGRIYGVQWRSWGDASVSIDQLQRAISRVKTVPNSRRNLVSAWNVTDVEYELCTFPPCHVLFQFRRYGDYLDLALYQRSGDVALGVPFNISSYALLLSMVAHECGLTARRFVHFLADCHIYANHLEGLTSQLRRVPGPLPTLRFSCPVGTPVVAMTKQMIHLDNYNPQSFIPFKVAI
jgi:thymidylate synthase